MDVFFSLKMMPYGKNIKTFGVSSTMILKDNLIGSLTAIILFFFWKKKLDGDEATDSHEKNVVKLDSNHTCLAIMSLKSAIEKDENSYP